MKRKISLAISLLLCSQFAFAEDEVDLRDLMTAREFQESGLHKLDVGELNALNRWLETVIREDGLAASAPAGESAAAAFAASDDQQPTATTSRIPRPEVDEFGRDRMRGEWKRERKKNEQALQATIVSDFTGWEGDTKFVLDNGQVWEQAESGRYYYPLKNPEVIISKSGVVGNYRMRVLATGRIISVRRVE